MFSRSLPGIPMQLKQLQGDIRIGTGRGGIISRDLVGFVPWFGLDLVLKWHGCWTKNRGCFPPKSSILIGFSI